MTPSEIAQARAVITELNSIVNNSLHHQKEIVRSNFIAKARTGWPAALDEIERLQLTLKQIQHSAMIDRGDLQKVLAENEKLRAENERLQKPRLLTFAESKDALNIIGKERTMSEKIDELRAENALLKAVAEAAEDLAILSSGAFGEDWHPLWNALKAWRAQCVDRK